MPSTRDDLLNREALRLKEIINFCRGAPPGDWPPVEEIWIARFQDLKRGLNIDNAPMGGARDTRHGYVRLTDVWAFAMARPDRSHWEWLIKFCRRWAKVLGVKLPATKPATWEKYLRWLDCAQRLKTGDRRGKKTELARLVAKQERANPETVRRRLDDHFPDWAD